MTKTRNLSLLCAVALWSVLGSCALFKPADRTTNSTDPTDAAPQFIPGITMDRGSSASAHQSLSYVSPDPGASTVALPASERRGILDKYAQILGVPGEQLTNLDLYDFIEDWWGTPYRLGGDGKDGIDCSAFAQQLFATVFNDNSVPRTASLQFTNSERIRHPADLREGDLVFFKTKQRDRGPHHTLASTITHVGIYLQNQKFVHASSSAGVTISSLEDSYWKKRYAGAGRLN